MKWYQDSFPEQRINVYTTNWRSTFAEEFSNVIEAKKKNWALLFTVNEQTDTKFN